jgi:hypothetical protein
MGGSAVAGPLFFCFGASFFVLWWSGVFAGVLRRMRVLVWCFCGGVVVICVADVVFLQWMFLASKNVTRL